MSIDLATVQKLAKLSRLSFNDQELGTFTQELGGILDFISTLQEVDTQGVVPMTSTQAGAGTPERADVVTATDESANHLANAPQHEIGFFVVPKVIE